jgi:nucleoside-diphosphate-sugar epimerase
MKKVIVCGGAGFIGGHLVKRLKQEGCHVTSLDIKEPEFGPSAADDVVLCDLREPEPPSCFQLVDRADEVYQLAASMGGAGYVFTGENDADIMHDNALININVLRWCVENHVRRVFYSSSACVYQSKIEGGCVESEAYPANPDSDYGWEKLFSERLYQAYARNHGLQVRIGRYHNVYGPLGTWRGGREKSPAAICRKVIAAEQFGGKVEIWGDGTQTRTFMYIDDCIDGTLKLMRSDFEGPVNLGSAEVCAVDYLVHVAAMYEQKTVEIEHIPGPEGVRGRSSDNTLVLEKLGWAPRTPLWKGLEPTYWWIKDQMTQVGLLTPP